MKAVPHPDAELLTAYLLGKLSWPEVEQVETHLGTCADCQSRVGTLEGRSDSFVSCLRGAAVAAVDDSALDLLLAGARVFAEPTRSHVRAEPRETTAGCELVEGEIFPGGLAVVFKAYHPILKDYRAIKRPKAGIGPAREILLARFRREIEVVGGLRHDHVVRAHDAGADEAGPYLVMEWLDGAPLNVLLKRHRPFPVPEACELARQAALGLQAAHERGLVHRDVKPSNLMLARVNSGMARVVVIDWGLAKRAGEAGAGPTDEATNAGVGLGTAGFMAPEQIHDARSVDIRADIYSLGATLYCLLAGRPPFHGRSDLDKLRAHEREPFPPLERQRPDLPPELTAVLRRMVEKDPARRYATPREVADALRPFSCAESRLLVLLDDGRAAPPDLRPAPPRGRRIGWLLAAAGLLILVVAVPVGLLMRGTNPPSQVRPDERRAEVVPAVLGDGPATPVSLTGRHPGHCSSLIFLPDGLRAVSESGGGGVYIWDLKKRQLEHSWLHMFEQPERNQDISGVVAASPDGRYIAAAGLNSFPANMLLLRLYDQKTYKPINDGYPFYNMSRAVAFAPDGSRLAAVELGGGLGLIGVSLRIIDVQTGNLQNFRIGSPVNSLAFSPDGKFLVMGDDGQTIRLWDLKQNRSGREFTGHAGAVDQAAFSADGKRVFSASFADGTLRVWDNDPDSGHVGKEVKQVSAGQGGAKVLCAAFWAGGRALAGYEDGGVVLWDLTTGAELKRFTHKDAKVTAVALSPDGRHALAALSDHLVYLYELPGFRTAP